MWKDREGRWIDANEFAKRFREGVLKVTPLDQTKTQILFTIITCIGLLGGIIVSIINIKSLWWLCIILAAGLGNTLVTLIAAYQKYYQLKRIEEVIKNGL